jgi:anaerobic nitric oxide reductase transcription regulator
MTRNPLFKALLPLVADLCRDVPEQERYARLLAALSAWLPGDAVALLKLEGGVLIPMAVKGLSPDTLGRRFRVNEHPRLERLLQRRGVTRFDADCGLPDPYDGLVLAPEGHLEVHDCMGCPLYVDDQLWGLLTLDSLDPACFDDVDPEALEAFATLAAATVRAAERIDSLTRRIEDERQLADVYRQAAGDQVPRELIGQSPAMQALRDEITVVGRSDLTVLITGETGVGKELVAQGLHRASPRARKPMINVNCAALPENLVESELFGHVRGAFSGAHQSRAGKFELANGGTLFLDEVGELPLPVQAKLLRVLQDGQLQRVGSDSEHRVDVRLLAATNRDLAEEVRAGRFRADLYHRLSVYPLRVPPLRERDRDVLLLAGFFLEENRVRLGLRGLRLSPGAQADLRRHDWPGNVRELEHLLARAALRASAQHGGERARILDIQAQDLQLPERTDYVNVPSSVTTIPEGRDLREAVDAYQRQLIEAALQRNGQRWSDAAQELGIDRANLNRLAKRLGLR